MVYVPGASMQTVFQFDCHTMHVSMRMATMASENIYNIDHLGGGEGGGKASGNSKLGYDYTHTLNSIFVLFIHVCQY